jgi:UDP-N-acetylmuramoyl-L-alanyl-D-glutamate--2,6-diaminopimelate ligase
MIKNLYKDGKIKSDFKVEGLCVLAQNLKSHEILFLKNNNPEKVTKIISDHVDSNLVCFIVTTKTFKGLENFSHIILDDESFEKNKTEMIDKFYPEKEMNYVGVTGTNGKTTTCWLLSEYSRLKGKNPLYVGTVGAYCCGEKVTSGFSTTTPSLLDLRKLLHNIKEKIDIVILEVSSHALLQERLKGVYYKACAWTNFTQDHLDFHGTMEEYFSAKALIRDIVIDNGPVFFNEDEHEIYDRFKYLHKRKAEVFKKLMIDKDNQAVFFQVSFNQRNLELALALYYEVYSEEKRSLVPLAGFRLPPGRFEEIKKDNVLFIIDYAHTPDALEKLLQEIKTIDKSSNIYCVIGCGGNRDKLKRPLMARAASSKSYMTILTTDNPRDENPMAIINDMKVGVDGNLKIVCDREEAIKKSFDLAKVNGGIVVVAGKGHENYQEVKGVRHFFSDREIVEKL